MIADMLAKMRQPRPCFAAQTQTIAQTLAIQTNEELHVFAPAACRFAGRRRSRGHCCTAVFGHKRSCKCSSAPGRYAVGVDIPAVYAAQHRLDIASGEGAAQLDQRLAHSEAIAVAVPLHPRAFVIVDQFAEEMKRIRAETGEGTRNRSSAGGQPPAAPTTLARNGGDFQRMKLMLPTQPGDALVEKAIALGRRFLLVCAVVEGGVAGANVLIPRGEILRIAQMQDGGRQPQTGTR